MPFPRTQETPGAADPHAEARARLMATVRRRLAEDCVRLGLPPPTERVLRAVAAVQRERFVPRGNVDRAFHDEALPLAHGQTVSQPSLVALMTAVLAPGPDDRVLEIGVGSGYQTAILARLCRHIHGIEYVPALAEAARARLADLGIANVSLRVGDGGQGWAEQAPFDRILAACAPRRVPQLLLDQLAPGGRLVLPVGPREGPQHLVLIAKGPGGRLTETPLLPVMFVPMLG